LFAAYPNIILNFVTLTTLSEENCMGAPHGFSVSAVTSLLCPNAFIRTVIRFNIFSGNTTEIEKSSRKKRDN
jgi:hypothetical protein